MKLVELTVIGLGLVAGLAMASPAAGMSVRTDVPKYIAEARKAIEAEKKSDAATSLDLAEAELDDVKDASERAQYAEQIKALRASMEGAAKSEETQRLVREVEGQMTDLKGSIGDRVTFDRYAKDLIEMLDKPAVKRALGEERFVQIKKQIGTFRKVSDKQAGEKMLERFERDLEHAEKKLAEVIEPLAENPEGSHESVARDWGYKTVSLEKMLAYMPEGSEKAAELTARYEAVNAKFNAAYGKAVAVSKVASLTRFWEGYEYEWGGWEQETGGLTFTQMMTEQNERTRNLGAPKTALLVQRANSWINQLVDDETYQIYKDAPAIVKVVADVAGQRERGWAKVAKNAAAVLAEAEKAVLDQDMRNRLETFANDDMRLAMEGHPELGAYQARALALVDAFDAKTVGKKKAAEALEAKLRDDAQGAWNGISQKFKVADGFDAEQWRSFKGRTIRLSDVSNRAGWDYKAGEYDFACTRDGRVIAGKFDPAVKKAVADILARTMHDELPEESYELFAVVESSGKITEIVRSEAEGDVSAAGGGSKVHVNAKIREEISTECVVVRIVALKVGPVATSIR